MSCGYDNKTVLFCIAIRAVLCGEVDGKESRGGRDGLESHAEYGL